MKLPHADRLEIPKAKVVSISSLRLIEQGGERRGSFPHSVFRCPHGKHWQTLCDNTKETGHCQPLELVRPGRLERN